MYRLSDRAMFIHGMVWIGLKWKITFHFSQDEGSPPPPQPCFIKINPEAQVIPTTDICCLNLEFYFLFCFVWFLILGLST